MTSGIAQTSASETIGLKDKKKSHPVRNGRVGNIRRDKMYILVYTSRRKNAKRHIFGRYASIEECRRKAVNPHYDFQIYDSKWNLIEEVAK